MVEAGINNFKMEMLGGSKGGGREVEKEKNMKEDGDNGEKDKREKDNEKEEDNKHKEQKDKKDKKEEKVRKVKAQFHQQECSSPRLTLPSPEATGATTSVQELNINIKNKISKTF